MNEINEENLPPWMNKHKVIQESSFCFWFMVDDPMKYIDNHFYTKDGKMVEDAKVKKQIYDTLSPWVETGLSRKTTETFFVMNGNRALIKRLKFEEYLDQATAV